MNEILNIMIIEDDNLACAELKRCIEQYDDLNVVYICDNSTDALDKARYYMPNVIILDLELHLGGGNGLMFLDELIKNPLPMDPFILVTTNNMSRVILEQAKVLGADFTLTKYEQNYCAQYVVDNIRMMRNAILRKNRTNRTHTISPATKERQLRVCIQRHLDIIGIKAKAKGFNYLTDAIYLALTEPEAHISKTLSEKYKKTCTSIERAMQNAIKQAWTTNDIDILLDNYTSPIRADKGYPTMMEFIYNYVVKIKQEFDEELTD